MLWQPTRVFLLAFVACLSGQTLAFAQSARTGIDVGPGRAGAWGSASGQFQHVDTDTRVGPNGSFARGLAIGAGPGGLALSHSIGVHGGGAGRGHNFNLSIGPGGSHVSGGSVAARGGSGRVQAGGEVNAGRWGAPPSGGSSATGFGRHVQAQTHARTEGRGNPGFGPAPFAPAFGPAAGRPFAAPRPPAFRGPRNHGRFPW